MSVGYVTFPKPRSSVGTLYSATLLLQHVVEFGVLGFPIERRFTVWADRRIGADWGERAPGCLRVGSSRGPRIFRGCGNATCDIGHPRQLGLNLPRRSYYIVRLDQPATCCSPGVSRRSDVWLLQRVCISRVQRLWWWWSYCNSIHQT